MGYGYSTAESQVKYFVPPTLVGDFDNFLATDIPGAVMDFKLIHNWYDYSDGSGFNIIRGEIYPDKSKSRYANTDNNINFRASISSGIQKGDYIIDGEEIVYLLDWDVPPQPNNKMSRALRCNCDLTFTRFTETEYDEDGLRVEDADRNIIIADSIPCNAYRYDGRPEFSAISYTPGISPNALTILSIQYNSNTKEIRAGDNFIWGNDIYIVIDVGYAGVSTRKQTGILTIQAKKEAGGDR